MGNMPEYISKYQIKGVIGRGSMTTVYRAYDRYLDRDVALKVLSDYCSYDVDGVERFLYEARQWAKIVHANVVPIHEVGNDGKGHYFIAMKLIEGETLADRIRQKVRYEVCEAVEVIRVVCGALAEAHRHGVVHRNISPMSVMIDVKGHVYVMGAPKYRSPVNPEAIISIDMYMSPESCNGPLRDARSDLYSLGVVMYEMLTGAPPFIEEPATVMLKLVSEVPEPPKSRNNQIPGWLNSVVMRLLAKEPGRRFQSCGELLEVLTVPMPHRSMSASSGKWLLIGLQGVAVLIVVVVVVVVVMMMMMMMMLLYKTPPDPVPPPPISAEQQLKERHKKAEDYISEGKENENIQEYIKAKLAYKKALNEEPENREAQVGFDRCKEILDKESKRIGEEKARKEEVESNVAKGRENEKTGNYARAKDAYSKALELEPGNSEAAAGIKRCESL